MSTFSVSGVEQKTVDALVAKLRSGTPESFQQNGNEFLVRGEGITANVSYNVAAKSLDVAITENIHHIPMFLIEMKLRGQIKEVA